MHWDRGGGGGGGGSCVLRVQQLRGSTGDSAGDT